MIHPERQAWPKNIPCHVLWCLASGLLLPACYLKRAVMVLPHALKTVVVDLPGGVIATQMDSFCSAFSPNKALSRWNELTCGSTWSQDEIDRLCQMMDAHVHQVAILRAFPGHRFFNLLKCYARHGTPDGKYTCYQGQRPYGVKTRWEDTEEYRREQ